MSSTFRTERILQELQHMIDASFATEREAWELGQQGLDEVARYTLSKSSQQRVFVADLLSRLRIDRSALRWEAE